MAATDPADDIRNMHEALDRLAAFIADSKAPPVTGPDALAWVIAELRKEADKWNERSMAPGVSPERRQCNQLLYQRLRAIANKMEKESVTL